MVPPKWVKSNANWSFAADWSDVSTTFVMSLVSDTKGKIYCHLKMWDETRTCRLIIHWPRDVSVPHTLRFARRLKQSPKDQDLDAIFGIRFIYVAFKAFRGSQAVSEKQAR